MEENVTIWSLLPLDIACYILKCGFTTLTTVTTVSSCLCGVHCAINTQLFSPVMVETFLPTFQGRFLLLLYTNEWMRPGEECYRLFYWIEVSMFVAWETSVVRMTNCPVTCYQHSSVFTPPPPPPPAALSSFSQPLSVCRYPHQPLRGIKRGISQSSISRTNFVWLAGC